MKYIIYLFFLIPQLSCSNKGSSPSENNAPSQPDQNWQSSDSTEATLSLCENSTTIPESCRVKANGEPYIEICKVEGESSFPEKEYNACGHGILHYRSFLCSQESVSDQHLLQIRCHEKINSQTKQLSLHMCDDDFSTIEPCGEEIVQSICYVEGSTTFPRKEYACKDALKRYKAFLCQVYPAKLTEEIFAAIQCDSE